MMNFTNMIGGGKMPMIIGIVAAVLVIIVIIIV